MNVMEIKNITKKYGKNTVLDDISLDVKKGEIHAILGENGAGKSTLMNILSGMPIIHNTGGFSGDIILNGENIKINKPSDAIKYGIYIVKQELSLIENISVWENIFLNSEITKKNIFSCLTNNYMDIIDKKTMISKSTDILNSISKNVSSYDICKNISIGEKYFVEIAREIKNKNINIIIFDEPTSTLTYYESKNFYNIMNNLSKKGISILFITHKLNEVIKYANTITILKKGKKIDTFENKNITKEHLSSLIIDKIKYTEKYKTTNTCDLELIMSLKNLYSKKGNDYINNLSLDIYKGEIIGIAGISGEGRNILGDIIGGIVDYNGKIFINNKLVNKNNLLKNNIAYVSYDRKNTGLNLSSTIYENICTSSMYINNMFIKKLGFINIIDKKSMINHSKYWVDEFKIECKNTKQLVHELSGGNQQKVCIAKALSLNPKILVLSEPTRGIDIGAKSIIMDKLKQIATKNNITTIIISSDLNELRHICDRIAILKNGYVNKILNSNESEYKFGIFMSEEVNSIE